MATSGKIIPSLTQIEISEDGVIWLIQNNYDPFTNSNGSALLEMQDVSKGICKVETFLGFDYEDEFEYLD